MGPSLLFKQGRQESDDQNWSSRERSSVVSGTVRQQGQSTHSSPNYEVPEVERSAEAILQSAPKRDSISGEDRDTVAKTDTMQRHTTRNVSPQARPNSVRKTHRAAIPESVIAPERRTPADEVPMLIKQTQAPEKSALESPDKSTSSIASPATDSRATMEVREPEASQQIAEPIPQEQPSVIAGGRAANSHVEPHPKTRQEVEDELRKARLNGTLPRFGNPDPYGPGGSPSTSDN